MVMSKQGPTISKKQSLAPIQELKPIWLHATHPLCPIFKSCSLGFCVNREVDHSFILCETWPWLTQNLRPILFAWLCYTQLDMHISRKCLLCLPMNSCPCMMLQTWSWFFGLMALPCYILVSGILVTFS